MNNKTIEKKINKPDSKDVNVATSRLRYLKIAPRKVRLAVGMIKNMTVNEAEAQLMLSPKRSSIHVLKVIKSCVANAKNKKMNENTLVIDSAFVDEGPTLKRFIPRAKGRATPINKRTSHITIVLKEDEKRVKSNRFVTEFKKIKKPKITKPTHSKKGKENEGDLKQIDKKLNKKTNIEQKERIDKPASPVKKFFRRKSI